MSSERFLIDTSAFHRLHRKSGNDWDGAVAAGRVHLCDYTRLEVLYSARSVRHGNDLRVQLDQFPWVPLPDQAADRAAMVQMLMLRRGTHRSAGPVDLLTAAVAELSGLTLLHYDRDFDTLAEITEQPTRWIADPGSLD
ncbi:PIN domain nuclease [Streptomyces sp. MK37H]|uniref:PIN domain nuclease n=1 Tax=Streptomyces sp. MK37H TaxID=2699117 RepID=UPI001B384A1C|nr:PIN domain nuclease [Streptomyces sp. MK37H]MBP8537608.1 PIN domain-containing protein [Streptomyces sp. MK37H]